MKPNPLKRLVYPLLVPWIVYRLRRVVQGDRSPEAWLDSVQNFRVGTFHVNPMQVRSEIVSLAQRVHEIRPRNVLEIGTAKGGTLLLWSRLARPDATLVSVDLPGGLFGGGYPAWKSPVFRAFAGPSQKLHLVRGDSHSPDVAAGVKNLFTDAGVDFLFLDGDHSADGVRADLDLYRPMVRPGGLVAFHDIVPGTSSRVGGVPELWQELRRQPGARTEELVEDWSQGGYGIGLLWV